jgi:hypothetical protein
MRARIISLISGVMIVLTVLSLQLITGCSSTEVNTGSLVGSGIISISEMLKNNMLEKITIASSAIVVISLGVLALDKHLDKQALKDKKD